MQLIQYILFQCIALALVPLFDSIIKNTKAIFNGRKWPHLLQTYFDFYKLLTKKGQFVSEFTSYLTFLSMFVILSVSLVLFYLVPVWGNTALFDLSFFVFFYIGALATFFMILYALDHGTYFGGLWAEREFFVMTLVEPVLILAIATLSFLFGTTDISLIHDKVASLNLSMIQGGMMFVLAIIFYYVLLAENKRFPFDNPATHLELTMIHEAMLLETNAKHLAFMEIASKIKLITFFSLFIYLFVPFTFGILNPILLFFLWIVKVFVLSCILGAWEIFVVKIRIFKYQNVFIFLFLLNIFMIAFYIFR